MFKCQDCKKASQTNEKPFKLVVETRKKTYTNTIRVGREFKVKDSVGHETVKELLVCHQCASNRTYKPEMLFENRPKFGVIQNFGS